MRHAETVTFGGSGLDRAAELRAPKDQIDKALGDPKARALLFWRGKPLIDTSRPAGAPRYPLDHPLVAPHLESAILLGREDEATVFAVNLSDWDPPEVDDKALRQFLDPSEQQHPDLAPGHVFAELRRVMTWLTPRDAELVATGKAILGWHATHGFCAKCGAPSDVTHGGWQRTCPSCGAHHFPRTDPVVIMLITHGNDVLVGRSPGWPAGMYSLLAGFVEPGETIEAAVRREVYEESGVKVGPVSYLASQPWPFPASLMIGCWGEATSHDIQIDPNEIEDARWISREDMVEIFAGNRSDILPARKGAIAHFLLQNWLADTLE